MFLSKDTWIERTAKMLSFNPKSLIRKTHPNMWYTIAESSEVKLETQVEWQIFKEKFWERWIWASVFFKYCVESAWKIFNPLQERWGLAGKPSLKKDILNKSYQASTNKLILKSCTKHSIFVFVSILDELYQGIVSQWCTKQLDAGCALSITSHARCFIVWQKWAPDFLSSRISSSSSSSAPPKSSPFSSSRSSEDALGH